MGGKQNCLRPRATLCAVMSLVLLTHQHVNVWTEDTRLNSTHIAAAAARHHERVLTLSPPFSYLTLLLPSKHNLLNLAVPPPAFSNCTESLLSQSLISQSLFQVFYTKVFLWFHCMAKFIVRWCRLASNSSRCDTQLEASVRFVYVIDCWEAGRGTHRQYRQTAFDQLHY